VVEHGSAPAPYFPDEISDTGMSHSVTSSTAIRYRSSAMNTMIDRLVVTPMSWLLAVPIVLLDRLLSPELTELPHRGGVPSPVMPSPDRSTARRFPGRPCGPGS